MKIIKWLLYFIAFILFLMFAGCGKKSNNTVTTHYINSDEINFVMDKNGAVTLNVFFADSRYAMASEDWIINGYSKALNEFLYSFKSNQWINEENDCDNFASMAFSFAQILHHNTINKLQKTALAMGEFWYIKKEGGGHAINVFIVWQNDENYKVIFYEPQWQKIIELTKEEIASVRYYRF